MKATTWQTLAWREETLLHHRLEWLVLRCRNQGKIQLIASLSSLNPPDKSGSNSGKDYAQQASGGQGSYFSPQGVQEKLSCQVETRRALGDTLSRHLWSRNFISLHALLQNNVYWFLQETPCRRLRQWIFLYLYGISPELFCRFPRISCLSYTEHRMDRRGILS